MIQVNFPAANRGGPTLPFLPPRPLHTVLMDATFPVPIATLWSHLLSGDSNQLADFHLALGDVDVSLTPWKSHRATGKRARVILFTVPLKNPLGPKQALNREELTIAHLSPRAFVLNAIATSTGVPFASAFENHVLWVVQQESPTTTRVTVTGDIVFTGSVFGLIKGTIQKESIKGMRRAYVTLESLLTTKFGILRTATPESMVGALATTTTQIIATGVSSSGGGLGFGGEAPENSVLSFLHSSQSNPAVLIMMVAMIVVIWRMAFLNTLTGQVFQRAMAAAAAARS